MGERYVPVPYAALKLAASAEEVRFLVELYCEAHTARWETLRLAGERRLAQQHQLTRHRLREMLSGLVAFGLADRVIVAHGAVKDGTQLTVHDPTVLANHPRNHLPNQVTNHPDPSSHADREGVADHPANHPRNHVLNHDVPIRTRTMNLNHEPEPGVQGVEDQPTEPDHAPEQPYRVLGARPSPPDEPTVLQIAELLALQANDPLTECDVSQRDRKTVERALRRHNLEALRRTWEHVMEQPWWREHPELRRWSTLLNDNAERRIAEANEGDDPEPEQAQVVQLSPPGTPEELWTEADWIARTGGPKPTGAKRESKRGLLKAAK